MDMVTKYKEDFILFLESGFIAVNLSDENSAVKCFQAAELLNPESTLPKVGRGYMYMHKLEIKRAIEAFEEALEQEPHNEMAKSLMGLCMTLSPTEALKGEKILAEMAKSSDSMIKDLSHTALEFVDKFVKKAPTPLQGIEKKKSSPRKK